MSLLSKKWLDALSGIGCAKSVKLLNGIYVTTDVAANRSTKLFNGHSGTKVQTVSFANASGK
jgi:hypothetical protein